MTFSLLFALTFFLECNGQVQNLCNKEVPGTPPEIIELEFAEDPSHCSRYLYCRRNDKKEVISVYQLDCRVNANHRYFELDDQNNGVCVENEEVCKARTCPERDPNNIMVAVVDDPTCTRFFPCAFPPLLMTCAQGLLFNRATGQCVLPSVAPCSDQVITRPECPRGPNGEMDVNGFFPGSFCHSFILCINSEIQPPELHCARGQIFVPNPDPLQSGRCEIDTAGTCDHSTNPSVPRDYFIVPQAPTRSIRNQKS
ncbi:hypothetical protein PVAND_015586 [Polypedilum vanderplanki]|uniref:Chitin-binding type-2 domain-containing protein n=1 Tax=Polypedilum vanderplanki TaxID=319348 RepID=A0A9J6BCP8_POLVA|nr:hypothetical protein PVAND_015586 [Polypedilum vanderplanki]